MKPLLGVCLMLCIIVLITIIVVLALIPLYLQTRDVTLYRPDAVPFLLIYGTNVISLSGLTVANVADLANQLMKQFGLTGIKIIYTQETSPSAGKKRQASADNNNPCGSNTNDQFIIAFTIEYPDGCNFAICETKFLKKVEYYITTLYKNITLSLIFTDSETLTISVSCCSLIQTALNPPPPTTQRPLVSLTNTGDTIIGLYGTTAGGSTGGSDGNYPAYQSPGDAIDSDITTKYLNFGAANCGICSSPSSGVDTGYLIIPAISSITTARGLLFATAEDAPNRDPITVTLEGSTTTDIAMLQQGSSWTLIYSGPTGIDATVDPGRNVYVNQQNFSNVISYASYRLLITSQRGADNSVQYAEGRIIGYA